VGRAQPGTVKFRFRMSIRPRAGSDDRRIWDYVYNGMLHSVVKNRAETNGLARRTLNLSKACQG
jgi:hypothetical protein